MSNVLLQPDGDGNCCGCRPSPCDSCDTCPEITLVCDSISASKSKCGFVHGGAYWREKICNAAGSATCGAPGLTVSGSFDVTTILSYDSECSSLSVDAFGSGSRTVEGAEDPTETHPWVAFPSIHAGAYTGLWGQTFTAPLSSSCASYTSSCAPGFLESQSDDCSGSSPGPGSFTVTISYDDEYTTSELISNAIAALPSYDDDFDDTCSATRALATDETSYSIQRFKHKWTFAAPATADCVISWNEHFVPTVGSPTDTARSTNVFATDTETSVFTVNEPSTNGTTTITDVTCELV